MLVFKSGRQCQAGGTWIIDGWVGPQAPQLLFTDPACREATWSAHGWFHLPETNCRISRHDPIFTHSKGFGSMDAPFTGAG